MNKLGQIMCVLAAVSGATIVACGGDSSTPDASQGSGSGSGSGSGAATVMSVSCTGITPDATVTTGAPNVFNPVATTINAGQVVEFMMNPIHNVVPDGLHTDDSGLNVNFGETKCLKFTRAGEFGFKCAPHGFHGTVTVN